MIVFLYIDGVLNCRRDWSVPYTLNKDCLDNFAWCFCETNIKIILTSSWRAGFVSPGNSRNSIQIQKLESELSKRGFRIGGTVGVGTPSRAKAIEIFLSKYPEQYIILDDDLSEFGNKMIPNLYLTDCKTGLTPKDVKKIRKML